MRSTEQLHKLGQSLWLDNITHDLLEDGRLEKYIDNFDVTGLTSNPTIYEQAIREGAFYAEAIKRHDGTDKANSAIFFELAIADLTQAAALFGAIHKNTQGVDGWVSLEVSPLLANHAKETAIEAQRLWALANCPNLFIKIPGTPAGLVAIEECIFQGVPINVTLLFSREHYLQAAQAYMRGLERRLEAGLDLKVVSVASLFVSRWDVAIKNEVAKELHNKLGVAIAQRTYRASQELMSTPRWQHLASAGALPQRLLWASTGSKDLATSDTFYIQELATPGTINTMPEATLLALGDHGMIGHAMSADGDNAEEELALFKTAGVDIDALAAKLQSDGVASFTQSWNALLELIASKRCEPAVAARPTLHLTRKSG